MKYQLPEFLFVGTAKAGTTSIYQYLKQHPDISIPVKETFYFMKEKYKNISLPYPQQRDPADLVLDAEQYKALYPPESGKMIGEIGTGYLYHHDVSIPLIKQMLGDEVKILIILRNPAERCFSSYMHFVKDLHESASFEEAMALEPKRKASDWDFMWMHKDLGFYSTQVEAYLNAFKNCKVLIYEEFIKDPKTVMNDLFAFLGLSSQNNLIVERVYNPSGEAKFKAFQKFITHENPLKSAIRPVFRMFFSKERREQIRKNAKAKNLTKGLKIPAQAKKRLMAQYMSDILSLEKILGRNLSIWYEKA
jgi:hypothetical protein